MTRRFTHAFALGGAVLLAAACGSPDDAGAPAAAPAPAPDASAPAPGAISRTQIGVAGFTFDVRVAGPEDGEVVVLLHGFPQSSYEWQHQMRALAAAGFRAVAPDQRGYSPGARPPDVADYALPLLVQDVLGVADAFGAERFHVVGHDWGAAVAWAIAAAAPERVITANPVSVPHLDAFTAVLSDPASCQPAASAYFDLFVQPDSEDGFLADDYAQLRAVYAELDADAVAEYIRVLGTKPALGAALNWYRANVGPGSFGREPLGAVTVPTMFTWSDADQALCIDGALLTEDYVAGPYRFEVLEGVSHWIPEVAPEALSALLLDHIGSYTERGNLTEVEATRDGAMVTVTWTAEGPVDVLVSDDPAADPETMTVVSAQDTDGRHVVRDLGGITRPYFYLRAGDGNGQRVAVRLLPLDGGRNFRDLGGYPTLDGRRVRWGRVFRSGMMAHLTDADYDYLSALGIRVVCDFRSDAERASEPTTWRANPALDYRTWDDPESGGAVGPDLGELLARPDATAAEVFAWMRDGYPHYLDDYRAAYSDTLHRLAAGELPLAFNCSAGKDRTGTAAALILSALGVPREVVVQDYVLSEQVVDYEAALLTDDAGEAGAEGGPFGYLSASRAAVVRPLLRADPAYIGNTLDYLDETYGGVIGYLRSALEIDDAELERIRAALLE